MPGSFETCPECDRPVRDDKIVCSCGNILRLELLRHQEPSDRIPDRVAPPPARRAFDEVGEMTDKLGGGHNEQATMRFDPVESLAEIFNGRAVALQVDGVDVTTLNLSALELFLYSKLDGRRSAQAIGKITRLKRVELSVLFLGLLKTGAIKIERGISFDTVAGETSWKPSGGGVTGPRAAISASASSGQGAVIGAAGQGVAAPARVPSALAQAQEQRAREQAAAHGKTHYGLYLAERKRLNMTRALWHLRRAVAFQPVPAYIAALEKDVRVLELCDKHYVNIRTLLARNQHDAALRAADNALAQFPGEAGFLNLKAIAIVSAGLDRGAAIACLERAVALDATNSTFLENLQRLKPPPLKRK